MNHIIAPPPTVEILNDLKRLYQSGQPVQFINAFHGVPITHAGKILILNQGYAVFQVPGDQAVCVALDKQTFLQQDLFPEIVSANTIGVDVAKGEVILVGFEYAGKNLGQRLNLRVKPKEPIWVEVQRDDLNFSAPLMDISVSGLGVYSFVTYIEEHLDFQTDASLQLKLELPSFHESIVLPGKISYIKREDGMLTYRLGIQVEPNEDNLPVLKKYIDLRRAEIMQELEQTYQRMCQL